jgi:hypothetical protein
MSDIQRWTPAWDGTEVGAYADSKGEYVTYTDYITALDDQYIRVNRHWEKVHNEALRQAREEQAEESFTKGIWKGQRDALAAAVQRFRSSFDSLNYEHTFNPEGCECEWCEDGAILLAAIKGGIDE